MARSLLYVADMHGPSRLLPVALHLAQRSGVGLLLGSLAAVALASCSAPPDALGRRASVVPADVAPETEDRCAPGVAKKYEEDPNAMCAEKTETPEEIAGTLATSSLDDDTIAFKGWSGPGLGVRGPAPGSVASCAGRTGPGITTCGPDGKDSCCRYADVPEGVGSGGVLRPRYALDVYEVTVARFESFVNAFNGDLRGAAASGKIPGWNQAWNGQLPASRAELGQMVGPDCKSRSDVRNYGALTWPSADTTAAVNALVPDNNARAADIRADATPDRLRAKPMNCVTYYLASAFCQWDGGALPTDRDWARAARGGAEARVYPWGDGRTADRLVTKLDKQNDSSLTWPADFPYFGNGHNAYHIAPPGRKPAGVGKWGHHDMAGNLLEWVRDIDANGNGIVRGGSWEGHADRNDQKFVNYPLLRSYGSAGMRCVRP
ncbi:MAG: SUMF1/EgtB/PvdO family nonheme iron enzyme [Polyangiaceae bacterium]